MPTEKQLSGVLSEFARTMLTDFPIQAILDHLVLRIVDVLPVTAAGVSLISPDEAPRYVAASNDSALRYEELQTELGEGPCLEAYRTGRAVGAPDLREEHRFPNFAAHALEAGLMAVFTFPLHHDNEQLGALDLYRDTPGPLDAGEMEAAQTLADVVSAYLINAKARADLRDSSDLSRDKALHDALTGLPNRVLLMERLDHAVLRGRRSNKLAAVLFTDLDQFKLVNDMHGHFVGDELLMAVAGRLTSVLRPGDTLARMSGDEFVILCEDLDKPVEIDAIAARVVAAIATPFDLSGIKVEITASVGIAYSGRGDHLSSQLLVDADAAMYQAKRNGGAHHRVIDLRERHLASERINMERELRGAHQRGELRAEYQPIVATRDGRITGVEALLRWAHPTVGVVLPEVLVPLAEQSGLITEIGGWVLEQACPDRNRWQDHGPSDDLTVAVNVSAYQLMSSNFAATVGRVLAETATDPKLLTLEVTESVFVQDSNRAQVVLRELKRIGVNLALDDFGTGYASLNYLKRFPIDIVKIDRGFITDMDQERASHAIVSAVIELSHQLGMTVVAEGVETSEQRDQLISLGCDYCQGFYFARPMSADAFSALVGTRLAGSTLHLPQAAGGHRTQRFESSRPDGKAS
jgi:diguanylate cyclase (GGDEF)-like protein